MLFTCLEKCLVDFTHGRCTDKDVQCYIWCNLTYYEAGMKHDPSHGEADVNSVEMEKSEYRLQ